MEGLANRHLNGFTQCWLDLALQRTENLCPIHKGVDLNGKIGGYQRGFATVVDIERYSNRATCLYAIGQDNVAHRQVGKRAICHGSIGLHGIVGFIQFGNRFLRIHFQHESVACRSDVGGDKDGLAEMQGCIHLDGDIAHSRCGLGLHGAKDFLVVL